MFSVEFHGNDTFADSAIQDGLSTRGPESQFGRGRRYTRYDASLVQRDRSRIETYYRARGFLSARVSDVRVKRIGLTMTRVAFVIDEGEPSQVGQIALEGLPAEVDEAALRSELGLGAGDRFDYGAYDEAKTLILARVFRAGYPHAAIEAEARGSRQARRVDLRYRVSPGPLVRIGSIAVRGLNQVPESAVRNRIAFAPGDVYSPEAVLLTKQRIRSLGRFGVVRVDFAEGSKTDVVVTAVESPPRELRIGAGVGVDSAHWEIRGRGGYSLHGFLDPLTTLSTDVRPAYVLIRGNEGTNGFAAEASARLTRPDLFLPLVRGTAGFVLDRQVLEAYSTAGGRVELGLSRPLWRHRVRIGLGWRLELLDFTDVDDAVDDATRDALGLRSPYRLGFFEQSVALDLRDNPLSTRRGIYAQLRMEQGVPFAGGEFSYTAVSPELRAYVSPLSRVVLAARGRFAHVTSGTAPITRRLFAGGATSQRGFSQRRLSPVAGDVETSDVVIGGDELFEGSVEARLDLFKLWGSWFGIVGFVDAGDSVLADQSIDFTRLHVASGGGIRYQTPVGPVRIDVGFRLNRKGAGEPQRDNPWAFHLSIGEAF